MQTLTNIGDNLVKGLAERYGLSYDAVVHMLVAVNNGGCSMAQFNCPELGGSGQWMRGGMTMVGDMFNSGLKNTVDSLCNELATILANNQIFPVVPAGTPGSNQWWPSDLGIPTSTGAQNNSRYAVFSNRLAVEHNGMVTLYDTLDHQIGGVSQQQGSNNSLNFTSQWGTFSVSQLPTVSNDGRAPEPHQNTHFVQSQTSYEPTTQPDITFNEQVVSPEDANANITSKATYSVTETLEIIEKLAQLHNLGAITEAEFNEKKSDLLKRI